jgi:MSHA biogenesis protein MshJ
MKAWWTRLAGRVNAMSLRERFLLFVCGVAILGAVTYLLFIAPLERLQEQRAKQFEMRSAGVEQQLGRIQVEILQRRRSRATEIGSDIARLQVEIDALEREIAELSQSASAAVAVPAMLRRVLRRTDKVALLRVSSADAAGVAPAAGALGSGSGLDITLAGGYLDLMEYLATLERALPLARWSALRFSAETVPAQVAVRVATPRAGP